ncbi:hypothetical protein RHSIM_Rhsim09G0093700 [Rhododendron simsii]|uniref:Chlororespiratory reduction 3 n=1 Tax=Rhododendron simsii TaxID=118357 RepID=A0A834GLD4_RHOSS|nr:hypothetical protein RHSIM_Rhsim09G0093700 [Rhododendron simsii]
MSSACIFNFRSTLAFSITVLTYFNRLRSASPILKVSNGYRAIGAGMFKDRDTSNRNAEKNKTLFDRFLSITIGETEGSVEKKLRESGEWIIDRTEKAPKSTGKNILVAVFLGLLPLWMLSFLVASGVVKLPFSTPFLDDLIM